MDISILAWVAIIVVALYFFRKVEAISKGPEPTGRSTKGKQIPDWLVDRWKAQEDGEAGFPGWFSDAPSERQIEVLKESGWPISKHLTKGTASDLIGLGYTADADEVEVAKFFKRNRRNLSQTEGREIVRQLTNSPEMQEAWHSRPPSALIKAQLKFLGVKLPKGASHEAALDLLAEAEPTEEQETLWEQIEYAYDEFVDPDSRDLYEIKKPTPNQVVEATKAIVADGEDPDDPDSIAEKLIELYPALEKA